MKKSEITRRTLDYFHTHFPELFQQKEEALKEFKELLLSKIQNIENLFLLKRTVSKDDLQLSESQIADLKMNENGFYEVYEYNSEAGNELYEQAHLIMTEDYQFSYFYYLEALFETYSKDVQLNDIYFEFLDFVLKQHSNFKLFGSNKELIENDELVYQNESLHDLMRKQIEVFLDNVNVKQLETI